jgi:hypothetical protein
MVYAVSAIAGVLVVGYCISRIKFQSTGEEEHPDVVQYEVEPRFSFCASHADPRCPAVGHGLSKQFLAGCRDVSRLQLRTKTHEQDRAIEPLRG